LRLLGQPNTFLASEPAPEPEPETTPELLEELGSYEVVEPAGVVIRDGFEMSTPFVRKLPQGTIFESLECRKNDSGIVRVRMDFGWTSVTTAAGEPLLRKVAVGLGRIVALDHLLILFIP
jgi:hypothetical protein